MPNSVKRCKNKLCKEYYRPGDDEPEYKTWCSDECREAINRVKLEKLNAAATKAAEKKRKTKPKAKKPGKKKAKKKLKSIAKEVEAAAVLLQLKVRLKAADCNGYVSCVVCGVRRHYLDGMQGGHFISRVKTATKLLEENVHPECRGCNMPGGGHEAGWSLYMTEMYGIEFIEELKAMSRETKKYTREEVETIKKELAEDIRKLEKRVN